VKKIILTITAVLFVYSAAPAAVKFAPYYSLDVLEGVSLPSVGDWALSLNLVNDIGLMAKIDDENKLVGFYELKYTGPGFRKEEGEKFSDRTMDHVFALRHQYNLRDNLTLETQFDFMDEFKRTGANEVWGQGLYDFERIGVGFFINQKYSDMLSFNTSLQYHTMAFPNYTDLLAEYQSGGADIASSAGKQNHIETQADASVTYGANTATFEALLMNYSKQKVIAGSVQADGTYYKADLQQDSLITIGASRNQKFWNAILLAPSVAYKIKSSNQNFQYFTTSVSSVPVQFYGHYYDYNELDFSVPTTLLLATKWEYFLNFEWDMRNYVSRPPQDASGNFVSGKQDNNIFIWGTGFTFKPNPVTRTTLFYQYQGQTSTMKFEKYFPYNYDGHFFGINFNYSY